MLTKRRKKNVIYKIVLFFACISTKKKKVLGCIVRLLASIGAITHSAMLSSV